jgi:hypothetical protein
MHYAVFSCRLLRGCLIRWLPHFAMLKIRSATIILLLLFASLLNLWHATINLVHFLCQNEQIGLSLMVLPCCTGVLK